MAVLAALSAEPGGATVAVIAGRAGISTATARQALIAHEKNGTATRIKGGRTGIADTWKPAPPSPAPGDEAPGAGGTGGGAEPATASADSWQPASADGTAEADEADAGTAQGPDPAVTTEVGGNVLAIAQAADEASKALAAGDLNAALAALDTAREQAACGYLRQPPAVGAPHDPARRAARPGRGAPAQVPRHRLHPAPGRQGTDPVGRRGRQRAGQAHRPRHRRVGHRQAPQLPARPPPFRPLPRRGRRPRD